VSNFFTPEFNNESAIAPWNASLEPTKAIIPQLDANPVLTGGIGQEVNIPTLTPEAYDNIILPDASLTRMASAVSTDSNTSLPDSSVDLLTGQAMSEVYGNLSKFAADPDFVAKLNVPFGENWDAGAAKTLAEAWFQGDFSDISPVKVVSSAEIGGANGAFAAATDTIYLSKEFLAGNAANPAAVADVLLEEIGHSVDARLNVTDSPGDEGAIFSRVVQGKELSQNALFNLKNENDNITRRLFDGSLLDLELAQINGYYPKKTEGDYTLSKIDPEATQFVKNGVLNNQELAKWKTGFNLQMSQRSPLPGQIIDFELTVDTVNTRDLFAPLFPYTVFGYPNNEKGEYGKKVTDIGSYVSWLAVRNGDFINADKWTLEIDDYSANPWTIEGSKISVSKTFKNGVNLGGEINFKYKDPQVKDSFEIYSHGNYESSNNKPYEWVGILNKVSPFNNNGKLFQGKTLKLKGQVRVETENVKGDWLTIHLLTQPIYSSTGLTPLSPNDTDVNTAGSVQLTVAGRIIYPLITNGIGEIDLGN
jgi:hypothetical protein